jgi:hypothetical protein
MLSNDVTDPEFFVCPRFRVNESRLPVLWLALRLYIKPPFPLSLLPNPRLVLLIFRLRKDP